MYLLTDPTFHNFISVTNFDFFVPSVGETSKPKPYQDEVPQVCGLRRHLGVGSTRLCY